MNSPSRAVLLSVLVIATATPHLLAAPPSPQRAAHPVTTLDDRYKVDILVVAAHPDDESAAAPYLARAINDEGKRVGVIICTHGEGGANEAGSEHAAALGAVREVEARRGLAEAGIHDVWFLDAHDTASQNVLQSLAHWGHGRVLEEMVRLLRLTRPEVVITWLPAVFVGEDHGDHQAAGVITTEAFDLAGDPTVFPAQVVEPAHRLEPYLEGLHPWQPKKLYFFSDSADDAPFEGKGPSYSITEVSPSRHMPYWRLGLVQARYYRSQFRAFADLVGSGNDQELEKIIVQQKRFWSDPQGFIFGKSLVKFSVTGDIFESITPQAIPYVRPPGYQATLPEAEAQSGAAVKRLSLELGGPWGFYREFLPAHDLSALPQAATPEIPIEAGQALQIPLRIRNGGKEKREVTLSVSAPEGWKIENGASKYSVGPGGILPVQISVKTPAEPSKDFAEIICKLEAEGTAASEVKLRVKLRAHALPQ